MKNTFWPLILVGGSFAHTHFFSLLLIISTPTVPDAAIRIHPAFITIAR